MFIANLDRKKVVSMTNKALIFFSLLLYSISLHAGQNQTYANETDRIQQIMGRSKVEWVMGTPTGLVMCLRENNSSELYILKESLVSDDPNGWPTVDLLK